LPSDELAGNGNGFMAIKDETEQRYYSRLWNIIQDKTNNFEFYRLNLQGNAELDTTALARFVIDNYPASIRHAVPATIYQMPKTLFSENVSRLLLNNSRKGFAVALKGKDGQRVIMANAGNGLEPNKKRTLVFTALALHDPEALRKDLTRRIIENDLEFVLQKNMRLKSNATMATILSSVSKNKATPKGTFEKNFKSFMREHGASASPVAAARHLFTAMPYTEKHKLNLSLKSMGIKSNQELEQLLHKWTAEALKEMPKRAISKARVQQPEYGR
jgi:hypothetical protein